MIIATSPDLGTLINHNDEFTNEGYNNKARRVNENLKLHRIAEACLN